MAVRDAIQTLQDEMTSARMIVDVQEGKYLKALGWEQVCRIDTVWFWQKTLQTGRVILAPRDLAVKFETRGGFDEPANLA